MKKNYPSSFETASRNNRDIWKICERSFATRMILCTVKVSTSIIDFPRSILLYRYLLPSYFQYGNSLNRLKFEKIGCNKLKRGTSVSKIIGRATKDQRITFPRNLILERAWQKFTIVQMRTYVTYHGKKQNSYLSPLSFSLQLSAFSFNSLLKNLQVLDGTLKEQILAYNWKRNDEKAIRLR